MVTKLTVRPVGPQTTDETEPAPPAGFTLSGTVPTADAEPPPPPDGFTITGEVPGVTTGGAALAGAKDAATFGFGDELSGAAAAARPEQDAPADDALQAAMAKSPMASLVLGPIMGAVRSIFSKDAQDKYTQARDADRANLAAAEAQHPNATLAGRVVGSLATPAGTAALRGAGLVARFARGAGIGAMQGGVAGFGSGEGLEDRLDKALGGAVGGAAVGGVVNGAIGPRVARPLTTPGAQAAHTAAALGAPLPVGLASDNRGIQAVTQAARQLPFVGSMIDRRAEGTVRAAGGFVNDMADTLAQGVTDRASVGTTLRPALNDVIEANRGDIDTAYHALRTRYIDPTQVGVLSNTERELNRIVRARQAAGQVNPGAGLEDVQNLVDNGAHFNGLQRARSDLGNQTAWNNPHGGFNAGDNKALYAAMSRDMEALAAANPRRGVTSAQAVRALQDANGTAAPLIEHNRSVQRLLNIRNDESVVGAVLNAANTKSGNVRLLAQLRNTMAPADFDQVTGALLHELGQSRNGEFSLRQFYTNWNRQISPQAKNVLFDPAHRGALDDIAQLGRHLKDTDKYLNTSGTGRAAALSLAVAGAGGAVFSGDTDKLKKLGGGAAAGLVLASILARPAGAASMSRWSRAYRAVVGNRNPATVATFNIATRNLAKTIGYPVESLLKSIQP